MKEFRVFVPLVKVDEERREIVGILAEEAVDQSGEILDYASSVPYFKAWSDGFKERTGGKSVGNLRAMHGNTAAGKFVDVQFDDAAKQIPVRAKVVDDAEWAKCLEGVYTGLSIGGKYVNRKAEKIDGEMVTRYTAQPIEGSLVDSPCMPGAVFDVLRANGSTEVRKFQASGLNKAQALQLATRYHDWNRAVVGSLAKGGAAAVAAADMALAGLKQLVAELALVEGDPATWTLEVLIGAIRAATEGKFEAEFQAEQEAVAATPTGDESSNVGDDDEEVLEMKRKATTKATRKAAAKMDDDDVDKEDEVDDDAADKMDDDEDAEKADDDEDGDAEATKAEDDAAAGPNSADDQATAASDDDADKADEDEDDMDKEDDDEEAGKALDVGALAKYLERVQGTLEKVLENQADVKGLAKSEDVVDLRKALDEATTRLAKIEARPAPVGRPVDKTLGNSGTAPTKAATDLSAEVDKLLSAGGLDANTHRKIRLALAAASVPRV